jgi:hypothetical protein
VTWRSQWLCNLPNRISSVLKFPLIMQGITHLINNSTWFFLVL